MAGYTYSETFGNDFVCIRYNTDGSLDTSFGSNGKMTYDIQLGSDDKAYSIDIQNDGKIILSGYSDNGSDKAGALIRINTDGSLDNTFGNAGKVITNFVLPFDNSPRADEFKVMKIHQITGNIVVAGTSSSNTVDSQEIFARYTSAGNLDTTFGTNGKIIFLTYPVFFNNYEFEIHDIVIKANGKITAIGWVESFSNASHFVYRLNSNGTLDTSFNVSGYLQSYYGDFTFCKSYALLLNPDDSILYSGGYLFNTPNDFNFYFGKISADGTSQTMSGSIDFSPSANDTAYDMEYDNTGKIVMAGSSLNPTTNASEFAVSRLNPDGMIDTTFGVSGKVTTSFGTNSFDEAFDMAIQSDNKIILVGYSGSDIALARYSGGILSNSKNEFNNSLLLHPNPTSSFLNITSENEIQLDSITIFNALGQLVLSISNANGVTKIDVSNLSAGTYFLKVVSDKGTSNVKFIKN